MTHRRRLMASAVATALALTWSAADLSAQAPALKRVELQRHDIGSTGREAVLVRTEFKPGAVTPRHTHPGEELAYLLEGELSLEMEGKPAIRLKAGESAFVPAGQVHLGKNVGKGPAIVLSTYIIEKGKPLVTTVK